MKYQEQKGATWSWGDLDMEFPYYENKESEEPNEINYAKNIDSDNVAISIDKLSDAIEYLKHNNSSHVYIYSDSDHHKYIFTGVKYNKIE